MKKLLFVFIVCCALVLCAIKHLMAEGNAPDNVIHLKCDGTVFSNKTALIYPNPFSLSTTIFYTPEINEDISIKIYTSKGIFMDELFHEKVVEGRLYQFILSSETMESGVYYCIIESSGKIIHQRIEVIH